MVMLVQTKLIFLVLFCDSLLFHLAEGFLSLVLYLTLTATDTGVLVAKLIQVDFLLGSYVNFRMEKLELKLDLNFELVPLHPYHFECILHILRMLHYCTVYLV
jgi:hypothetical protein